MHGTSNVYCSTAITAPFFIIYINVQKIIRTFSRLARFINDKIYTFSLNNILQLQTEITKEKNYVANSDF